MNFLAHLYLSKNNKNILIGNFIADAVKGKNYQLYSEEIQAGILLHREIDSFTDKHSIVRISKNRLNNRYRHYNGVIVDILYDHFLAKNWHNYSEIPLNVYANSIYDFLQSNIELFPQKIQQLVPNMIAYNWLENYAKTKGIKQVLNGMNKRTNGVSQMNLAIEDLNLHYNLFEEDFTSFFNELIQFTEEKLQLLINV